MFDLKQELSENVTDRFYIDGQWVECQSSGRYTLIDPATERELFEVPLAGAADVERAVSAARVAFDNGPWPRMTALQRSVHLHRLADALAARAGLHARLWTLQVGAPISLATALSPRGAARVRYYADLASRYAFEVRRPSQRGSLRVRRVPVGVAALVVPWNAVLPILAQKLGAALAAGCTCVVKSPPESPLDALVLAECAHEAGIPPGVVNVITADRVESALLVASAKVDKVSFTGSLAAGKQIAISAADRMARVTLELGGKSAAILLDDAVLTDVMPTLVPLTMPLSGQFCFAQSRLLVPRSRLEELVRTYVSIIDRLVVGDPWNTSTQIGPLLNRRQMDRTLGYIEQGREAGARVVAGGHRSHGQDHGFFVAPTVFTEVNAGMAIAREEIFGPVVTIQAYDSEEEAINIANDTDLGLSGTVFSQDCERAYEMATRLRTGQVGVNGLDLSPDAPFGGHRKSGMGREGGPEGLEAFLETTAILMPSLTASER
ncbi:MAG: aldehyde dehydrogenase [Polaromonas sp.]|nr:aldehyde dehydrogenase [Polaromonas sp.]